MKQNSIKDHVRKILHVKSCEPEIKRFISKFAWLPTHPNFLHARNVSVGPINYDEEAYPVFNSTSVLPE